MVVRSLETTVITSTYLRCDTGVFEKMKNIPGDVLSGMLMFEAMKPNQRRLQ